jgi:hypothetical protein
VDAAIQLARLQQKPGIRPLRGVSMRAILTLATAGVLGCGGGTQRMAYTPAPAGGPRPATVAHIHDSSLAVLQLPPLATHAVPSGVREIRLSTGSGMIAGADYPLLRVVAGPEGVRGELVHWAVRVVDGRVLDGPTRWTARRVAPVTPIDWVRVLARLDSLGVDSLVPPVYSVAVTDAGDLAVEVRQGAAYRAYEVNAPGYRSDPVGRRAAAIMQLVDSLDRLTRRD